MYLSRLPVGGNRRITAIQRAAIQSGEEYYGGVEEEGVRGRPK